MLTMQGTAIIKWFPSYLFRLLPELVQLTRLIEKNTDSQTFTDCRPPYRQERGKNGFSFGPFLYLCCIKWVCADLMNRTFIQSHPGLCFKSLSTHLWLRASEGIAAILNTVHNIKRFPHGWKFSLLQEFHCNISRVLPNQLCLSFSILASKHQAWKNTRQCQQNSDLKN